VIAAWVALGLIAAFLALNAWADAGDAIAGDTATDDDEIPLADTPATRLVIVAVGLVLGASALGLQAVLEAGSPDPGSRAGCVEVPRPVTPPADPATAEALAALRSRIACP
jgi:hypothetical protein